MDTDIVAAIWFSCHDLTDTQHKLLLAIAYHGSPCWPSVGRLAKMIRRTPRQTRILLRELEKLAYLKVKIQRGRDKSNIYTINRKRILPISGKIGNLGFLSKSEVQTSPELEEQKEKKEGLLRHLGLEEGSGVWIAAMNGHQK